MSDIKKPVGRPAVNATPVTVRVPPALLGSLDAFLSDQEDKPGRPEAIRRLVQAELVRLGYLPTAD